MKTLKTRRKKVMKGCGKGCNKKGCKRCNKSKRHMKGGCGTCSQSGGNGIIYPPVSSMGTTILSTGMNVIRAFQGLIPI
jgi:hypothetical protein